MADAPRAPALRKLGFAVAAIVLFPILLRAFAYALVVGPEALLIALGAPEVVRTIWSWLGLASSLALTVWVLVQLWRALAHRSSAPIS
jgi:hypothetical protein